MRSTHLAVLVAGLALAGCVGVPVGRQSAPYPAYTGDSRLVTPYPYRRGGDNYLFDQSRRSRPPIVYQPSRAYAQPRYVRPDRRGGPPGNPGYGRGNGRDRYRD